MEKNTLEREAEGPLGAISAAHARHPGKPYVAEAELVRLRDPAWFPAVFWLYLMLAAGYIGWRVLIVNWHTPLGPALFAVELFSIAYASLHLWTIKEIWVPSHRPAPQWGVVDVLITTVNEPLEVIEPTVAAAMRVRGIRRVLVLDDGARPEVEQLAHRYGARWIGRTSKQHAKAGNLNNGLQYTDAEFILEFDVDHIPRPEFLERTMGHFDDPLVAVVQTPQTYYNTDSFLFRRTHLGLWSDQGMFYDTIQPGKNRSNSAFFVGTSAVLRRKALDSIGGYSTSTATEDIHTALRLHAAGWKSVFVPEVLAEGLETASLLEFFRQRRRWAAGSFGLLLRSKDSPLVTPGLSLAQRLNYIAATLGHVGGLQRLVFLLLPVLAIFTLQKPILVPGVMWLAPMMLFALTTTLAVSLYGRGSYHPIHTEAALLVSWMSSLAGLWGVIQVRRKFSPSRKLVDRKEGLRLKAGIWGLFALVGLALARGAWLLYDGKLPSDLTASIIVPSVLCVYDLLLLGSFLIHLERYERSVDQVSGIPERLLAAVHGRDEHAEVISFAAFEAARRDRERKTGTRTH